MNVLALAWDYPPHQLSYQSMDRRQWGISMAEQGCNIRFALPYVYGDEDPGPARLIPVLPTPEPQPEPSPALVSPRTGKKRTRAPLYGPSRKKKPAPQEPRRHHHYFGRDSFYDGRLLPAVEAYATAIGKTVKRDDLDLIHAFDWPTIPAALKLKERFGKKLVLFISSLEPDRCGSRANRTIETIEKRGIQQADHVITVSHQARSHLMERFGLSGEGISVIHPAAINSVTRTVGQGDERTVLFLGPLSANKGPENFIDAAARVAQHIDRVRFIMTGSGDKLETVIRRVNEWGIGKKVHFTGLLDGRDHERILRETDLCVIASAFEPFGFEALDMVAHGIPVIVTRQTGASEILRSALKFDCWDVNKLAETMIAVLQYDALARDLSEIGLKEVTTFGWHPVAEKTRQCFFDLLNQK